jgi:hypothetical protein
MRQSIAIFRKSVKVERVQNQTVCFISEWNPTNKKTLNGLGVNYMPIGAIFQQYLTPG